MIGHGAALQATTRRRRALKATAFLGTLLIVNGLMGAGDQAKAGSGQFLGGVAAGVAAGVIGGIIINKMNKKKNARGNKARSSKSRKNRGKSRQRGSSAPRQNVDSSVRQDQEALTTLRFYAGGADGVKGAVYENAVVQYKVSKGLIGTSILSDMERALLHAEAKQHELAAMLGDPSMDPMFAPRPDHRLQTALQIVGYYDGRIDGKIGPKSRRSISAYQSANGMAPTGILSPDQIRQLVATAAAGVTQRLAGINQQIAALPGRQAVTVAAAASAPQPGATVPVTRSFATAPGTVPIAAKDMGDLKNASWDPIEATDPAAKISRPYDVAVLVGNRNYQNDIPAVTFGHRDADAMKSVLINKLGFDTENIIDLRDASQGDMATVFGNQASHKGKIWNYVDPDGNSKVYVFYSGHGVPDIATKTPYILPVDANPSTVEINGFPLELLYKNIGKLDIKKAYVFLDACFSGGSNDRMLIEAASPVYISAAVDVGEASDKLTILAAASGDQLASWDQEKGHGLFTLFTVEGLNGAADENKDHEITAKELHEYVRYNVRRQARRMYGRDQTPVLVGDGTGIIAAN